MSGNGETHRMAKEKFNMKYSGGEQAEMNPPENVPNRKRCKRHTPQQIQTMEEFFRDCPHPDQKQRVELSQDIGIDPLQVKFWFQNKRTHVKTKQECQLNKDLQSKNEKLRAENVRFRGALSNASCSGCGRMVALGHVPLDERQLRMENAYLRNEINRISRIAATYIGRQLTKPPATPAPSVLRTTSFGSRPMFRGSSSSIGMCAEDSSDDEPEDNNQ